MDEDWDDEDDCDDDDDDDDDDAWQRSLHPVAAAIFTRIC